MSKRYAIPSRALTALCVLASVALFHAAPLRAADTPAASAATQDHAKKAGKAKPAVTAPAPQPAAPKPVAAPKPPKPAEKSYAERRVEDGVWAHDATWLMFRAGYAKGTSTNEGDGLAGYGMGFQHMISNQWSVGVNVDHDLLAHLGNAYEISVPFTVDFTRHFRWNTAAHPYLGVGGGYFFHKYYRTGPDDTGAPGGGPLVRGGFELPLSDRHVLGLDTRAAFMSGRSGVTNPVFGPEESTEILWSAKLTWALVY